MKRASAPAAKSRLNFEKPGVRDPSQDSQSSRRELWSSVDVAFDMPQQVFFSRHRYGKETELKWSRDRVRETCELELVTGRYAVDTLLVLVHTQGQTWRPHTCTSHALLHALNTQLSPPRALHHTSTSLRHALIDFINDLALTRLYWSLPDSALAPVGTLQDELDAIVADEGRSANFAEHLKRLRSPTQFGDGVTVIAASLLLQCDSTGNVHTCWVLAQLLVSAQL